MIDKKSLENEITEHNKMFYTFCNLVKYFEQQKENLRQKGDKLIFQEILNFKNEHGSKFIWIKEGYWFNTVYASEPFCYNGAKFETKTVGTECGEGVRKLLKEVAKEVLQSKTKKDFDGDNHTWYITFYYFNDDKESE